MKVGKRVLVIGLGRFGTSLVRELWEHHAEIVAVDRDARAVDDVKEITQAAFVADATDPRVLEDLASRQVDIAVVTFGENFEATVLAVATLNRLGVPQIVARAATKRRAGVLKTIGATRVVQLEEEMGSRIGQELAVPVAADLLEFASHFRVVPWTASGAAVGKSIRELAMRERFGVNVLGIRSHESKGSKLAPPRPEHAIREGDVLLLVGEEHDLDRFLEQQ